MRSRQRIRPSASLRRPHRGSRSAGQVHHMGAVCNRRYKWGGQKGNPGLEWLGEAHISGGAPCSRCDPSAGGGSAKSVQRSRSRESHQGFRLTSWWSRETVDFSDWCQAVDFWEVNATVPHIHVFCEHLQALSNVTRQQNANCFSHCLCELGCVGCV